MAKPVKTQTAKNKLPPLRLDDARLIWRNFAGAQKRYNAEGLRNFHVVIDEETAQLLMKDGWNVKAHKSTEENGADWYTLKVSVRFDNYPPSIILKNGNVRTQLNESMLEILDWAEITSSKLMINGSRYETPTSSGVKAYLSRMVVSIAEQDFEFSGLDESAPAHPDSNEI
jgi:hypothetical protein